MKVDDKKKKQIIRKNFLESLRELGNGVAQSAKKDVAGGVAKTAAKQVFGWGGEYGENKLAPREAKERLRWSRQEFTDIRVQERLVFKQAEEEVKVQIETIRVELLKLIETTQGLTKEVKVAAMQAPVEPGVYHLNFLEKLREFIIFLRKNIAESRNWLAISNQRAKKRNYYWRQVKKSGTKFMLSQERYMATQAG